MFQATCPVDNSSCKMSEPDILERSNRDELSQQAAGQMYLDSQGKLCGHCPNGLMVSQVLTNGVTVATRNGRNVDDMSSHNTSRIQLQLDSHGHLCTGQKGAVVRVLAFTNQIHYKMFLWLGSL